MKRPPAPNASPNPTADETIEQIAKIRTFLAAMWPTFFMRVRPASRKAKPACMNMTSTAAITTQTVLTAMPRSLLDTCLPLLELHPGSVVDDVQHRLLPHQAVAGLVAAAGRVAHGRLHCVCEIVADEEGQDGLRQEPRLEHTTAVLVCDAALPAVSDRLDDRHTHVTGRLLDGVDHGLDPFADHDRLNLHHRPLLPLDSENRSHQANKK